MHCTLGHFLKGKKLKDITSQKMFFRETEYICWCSMEASSSGAASHKSTLQELCLVPSSASPGAVSGCQGHASVHCLSEGWNAGCRNSYRRAFRLFLPCQAASNLTIANQFQRREGSSIFKPVESLASLWELPVLQESFLTGWGNFLCI